MLSPFNGKNQLQTDALSAKAFNCFALASFGKLSARERRAKA
jgi:hypothetical protein